MPSQSTQFLILKLPALKGLTLIQQVHWVNAVKSVEPPAHRSIQSYHGNAERDVSIFSNHLLATLTYRQQ